MNVWPLTAEPAESVGGVQLTEIADRFGTPVYVLDEEHVRFRCGEYGKAMAPHQKRRHPARRAPLGGRG
ncbi:MAG TPA: hypothetical protein VGD71_41965 [Kribbella sp.]|jgi:diaminopimelate decarboxylase